MNFAKSAALTFVSNLLSFFMTLVTATVISRILGAGGKGIVDVANNFSSFAILLLGFGLASSNIFFLGKDRETLNPVLGNNLLLAVLSILFLIPFYFLNSHFHFQILRGVSELQLILVLITVPLVNFKAAMVNILLGLQDVVEYNRINVMDKLLNLLLLVGIIFFLPNPTSALLAILAAALLMSFWEVYILIHRKGARFRLNFQLIRKMLSYGVKALVGNILQKINYRLDVFIVNYYLPIDQVGIYGVAVVLGETLWGVSSSIATLMFPIVSAAKAQDEIHRFTNQVTRITFTLVVLFSLVLALISKPLILLFFGKSFLPAVSALIWLLPGIGIFSISNILANYLAGAGEVEKNIYSSFISGIVTVVFDLLLVPRIGINGASIATSLSYSLFTLTTLFFYQRKTRSAWKDILLLKRSDLDLVMGVLRRRIMGIL